MFMNRSLRRIIAIVCMFLVVVAALIGYIAIDIALVGFWSERSDSVSPVVRRSAHVGVLLPALALIYLLFRWGWRKRD